MRHELDIDLIFPIKDETSAWLMCLKAESLCEAGIIDTDEMNAVLERAAEVIDQAQDKQRGAQPSSSRSIAGFAASLISDPTL